MSDLDEALQNAERGFLRLQMLTFLPPRPIAKRFKGAK